MIAVPKFVDYEAWYDRKDGRPGTDEVRHRIKARPANNKDDYTEFVIEACRCVARGEASFTLFGKLIGYPEQAICRYETQLCLHKNPKWFPPPLIQRRAIHRHVYNERAIREDWPWDKCAELVTFDKAMPRKKLSLQQYIERIGPKFLKDTNTEVHDPDSRDLFHMSQ